MLFKHKDAQIFVPDSTDPQKALQRTTHMAVASHPDDIEIMAYDGIVDCYEAKENWFLGVVLTTGTGSIRTGKYSSYTDHEFKMTRFNEQKEAAKIGKYSAVILLDYPSSEVKDPGSYDVVNELLDITQNASPKVMYIHNLADKHLTHVASAVKTILAIRRLPKDKRPDALYGCEVWRSLDWMADKDKTVFDVDKNASLARSLLAVYESQISGAKKYDEAAIARRLANSTFFESVKMDASKALSFAMDLTELIRDDSKPIADHVISYLDSFKNEVIENINRSIKE